MNAGRWAQVKRVFGAAIELPTATREGFLRRTCGEDEELRLIIQSLLRERSDSPAFSPPAALYELTGKTIGHFEVGERIAAGGMGVVYRARDTKLDRQIALKVWFPQLVVDDSVRRRMLREGRAAAAVVHPNVCTVHEVGEAGGEVFLAMELVEGRPLSEVLRSRMLQTHEALNIAIQVANGLQAAHRRGVVHRDIKSANVMVDETGRVKILDFGLARMAGDAITRSGALLGTPAFMSPEQAQGQPTDERTDIWSLGVLTFEMLAGERPFSGDSEYAVIRSIVEDEPERPKHCPPAVWRVVRKSLVKDLSSRYQSMDELLLDLQSAASGGEPRATVRPKWPVTFSKAKLALALGAVVSAVLFRFVPQEQARQEPVRLVQATSLVGRESDPALSPDGTRLVFTHGPGPDDPDLHVQTVGSSDQRRLTEASGAELGSVWSPDGRTVAYVRYADRAYSYWLVEADGGAPEKLLDSRIRPHFYNALINWSPDGKSLAVVDRESDSDPNRIFQVDLDSGRRRAVTTPPAGAFGDESPSFSADGSELVFIRRYDQDFGEIRVVDLPAGESRTDSAGEVEFGDLGGEPKVVRWAPGGDSLLVATFQALYRVPVVGGPGTLLQSAMGSRFSHSRQGNRVAFERVSHAREIWRMPGPAAPAARAGGAAEPFIRSSVWDLEPSFSPDGTRVAFGSNRLPNESGLRMNEVWISSADGSQVARLTDVGGRQGVTPAWSPDGETIAFWAKVDRTPSDVYLVNSTTGQVEQLTADPARDWVPSFSADGRWVYFASERSGSEQIWRKPVGGGEAIQVTTDGGFTSSEDGRFLYYSRRGERGLWRLPVTGGTPRLFVEGVHALQWDLCDRHLCYVRGGESAIVCMSTETEEEVFSRSVDRSLILGMGLAISPDSRWILFGVDGEQESDIVIAEGLTLD